MEQERIANAILFHSFPAVVYCARQQALYYGMGASTTGSTIYLVGRAECFILGILPSPVTMPLKKSVWDFYIGSCGGTTRSKAVQPILAVAHTSLHVDGHQ